MTKENTENGAVDVFGRAFILKADMKQRDVAAWNRAYIGYGPRTALADERQAALQAAIDAGWIESPPVRYEDVSVDGGKVQRRFYFDDVLVDDMLPAEVNYYGSLCSAQFDRIMSIPKRSSSQ
jgi:hypothetical protein